jgi:hypothetical protein
MVNNSFNEKFEYLKSLRAETNGKKIETIQDVTTIDELNELIGDDNISDEEYQDMVIYIQNKNSSNNKG